MKTQRKIFPVIFGVMMLLFVSGTYAQDTTNAEIRTGNRIGMDSPEIQSIYSDNATRWSQSLSDEITLNDDQRNNINSVLMDYQRYRATNPNLTDDELNELNMSYNNRISTYLNQNQVDPFNTYSETWWDDINTSINTSTRTNSDVK